MLIGGGDAVAATVVLATLADVYTGQDRYALYLTAPWQEANSSKNNRFCKSRIDSDRLRTFGTLHWLCPHAKELVDGSCSWIWNVPGGRIGDPRAFARDTGTEATVRRCT